MMSRRQWAWIAGLGLGLAYVVVFAKLAYDRNALDAQTSGGGAGVLWGVAGMGAAITGLGIVGTIRETSNSTVLERASSFRGHIAIVVVAFAAGTFFLVAALRAQPPRNWTCVLKTTSIAKPDMVRCGRGTYAQMRTFTVVLERRLPTRVEPVMRAAAADRARSSVALDSTACTFRGPDWPAFGESQLALVPACGDAGRYEINLRVCDIAEGPATTRADLAAVAQLEVWEAEQPERVACD